MWETVQVQESDDDAFKVLLRESSQLLVRLVQRCLFLQAPLAEAHEAAPEFL